MPGNLNGLNILVTRPEHQAHSLCQLLRDQGATPLAFPLINIQAIDNPEPPQLNHYDIIIFVSNNAVKLGIPLIKPLLENSKLATVGKGTAKLMAEQGYPADILPERQFDSEGLLAHSNLQDVKGRSI